MQQWLPGFAEAKASFSVDVLVITEVFQSCRPGSYPQMISYIVKKIVLKELRGWGGRSCST